MKASLDEAKLAERELDPVYAREAAKAVAKTAELAAEAAKLPADELDALTNAMNVAYAQGETATKALLKSYTDRQAEAQKKVRA